MLVQTPESAQFDGMPKSEIQTGIADSIAAPENMPQEILRYVEHPWGCACSDKYYRNSQISEITRRID